MSDRTASEPAAAQVEGEARPAAGDLLLEIEDLRAVFSTDEGPVRALDGVSLRIHRREIVGVVGESGCGKTVTALSIMRLLAGSARLVAGRILLYRDGPRSRPIDLTALDPKGRAIRRIRGNDIAMIFQEPMTSLSPVHTIGNQIAEVIRLHQRVGRDEAQDRTIDMLRKVQLPKPARQVDAYPHELSGGMRQRAMIAMALACSPLLLIADEPTTALDVTVQAEILELIGELQRDLGMAVMFITHDLGVVANMADSVTIMYMGKVVEQGPSAAIFRGPRHPYTRGLVGSIPRRGERRPLVPIPGSVPDPRSLPPGCSFGPRCRYHTYPDWERAEPPLEEVEPGHYTRCCGTVPLSGGGEVVG